MAPPSATASAFSSAIFSASALSLVRPTTRDGSSHHTSSLPATSSSSKERKASFSRKASLPGPSRRRGTWTAPASPTGGGGGIIVTDAAAPPALPEFALAAAAKVAAVVTRGGGGGGGGDADRDGDGGGGAAKPWSPASPQDWAAGMLSRAATGATSVMMPPPPTPVDGRGGGASWQQQSEALLMHQQMTDVAHKRISTLDYLRKAHEGRVYWFNTYLFDKSDLARMPAYDPRKLARKATNHLLLGLSIPTINDLYSSTPLEFLRCLNGLLSEFDSFQQLHGDSTSAASLTRARIPNMFRRPGTKSRRSTSASADAAAAAAAAAAADDSNPFSASAQGAGASSASASASSSAGPPAPAVMNFAASESDLLPGEEYTYLLTPSLPFDPDFFETFATLCDVLIDCYTRFLALVPTPRECSAPIAELFTKADGKMRKIIVQAVVKDFEEQSRTHVKAEVAGIGKVVLGGLM